MAITSLFMGLSPSRGIPGKGSLFLDFSQNNFIGRRAKLQKLWQKRAGRVTVKNWGA
jgi:hypothetical protein